MGTRNGPRAIARDAGRARIGTEMNMGMGRPLEDTVSGLPAPQRNAVERRAQELIAEQLALRNLRKAPNP
jgi:hypothetical protein